MLMVMTLSEEMVDFAAKFLEGAPCKGGVVDVYYVTSGCQKLSALA